MRSGSQARAPVARSRLAGAALAGLAAALLATGCTKSTPYRFGSGLETPLTLALRPGEAQFERGRPVALLDAVGHYLISLPGKILLLDWQIDRHRIEAEVEDSLAAYLAENDLPSVKVRLNQYAPGNEWSRLFRNREMPGGWRYTVGVLSVVGYTILPGRFFGGDHYNPFTNSIHLYSNRRAVALHEGGHAKDFAGRGRHWKGPWAALRILPLVPLWQEGIASRDAILYERERGGSRDEKQAYRLLYPAFGTYVGGEATRFVFSADEWIYWAVRLGAVVPGHIAGQIQAALVEERPRPEPAPEGSP